MVFKKEYRSVLLLLIDSARMLGFLVVIFGIRGKQFKKTSQSVRKASRKLQGTQGCKYIVEEVTTDPGTAPPPDDLPCKVSALVVRPF